MKIFATLCFFICFTNLTHAQDTARLKSADNIPLYIIDGKLILDDRSADELKKIEPKDILDISVLKDAASVAKYGPQAVNGVVIVTTRFYARKAYELKLATLSSQYKKYIEKHGDDSKLAYVLNNVILDMQRKSNIEDMYQLSVKNIDKITFKKDSHFSTDATVIITTKDN